MRRIGRRDDAPGMIVDVNFEPTIVTNDTYNERVPVIQVVPITEWSLADCLQTRPIDRRHRLRAVRGNLEPEVLEYISRALKVVFALPG